MQTAPDWTDEGAHEVTDHVYRLPLPLPQDGLRAVNVYVIELERELVLIDGGWALLESQQQLARSLKTIGASPADVTRILVTHAHRDHYTQAVAIRREFGSRISLGSGERRSLDAIHVPGATALAEQLRLLHSYGAGALADELRRLGFGAEVDQSDWEYPDEWLTDRQTLQVGDRNLEAIPTPGHTQGHFVFVDREHGLLFAGDHVLPHITPSIGFEHIPSGSALQSFLRSLAVVRDLPDLALLPAHGPVTASSHARIDELVAHHDQRLAATREALASGAGTPFEVARRLRWTRRGRAFDELDPFNQMLAVMETAAHVHLLEEQERPTA